MVIQRINKGTPNQSIQEGNPIYLKKNIPYNISWQIWSPPYLPTNITFNVNISCFGTTSCTPIDLQSTINGSTTEPLNDTIPPIDGWIFPNKVTLLWNGNIDLIGTRYYLSYTTIDNRSGEITTGSITIFTEPEPCNMPVCRFIIV